MKNVINIMNTQIPQIINIGKEWANGQTGLFCAFDDYTLRFRALNSDLTKYLEGDNWVEHAPIIARGFIVYFLYSTQNRRNYKASNIYAKYYQHLCDAYKEIEDKKPDEFKRNLDNEFYAKHIVEEKERIKFSQPLFDYLTKEEERMIRDYIDGYFDYVKSQPGYYADKSNFPNQTLVRMTIKHIEKERKDMFTPLEFLNLLDEQREFMSNAYGHFDGSTCDIIPENKKHIPDMIINHLQTLPLTEEKKHVLYGFIYLWYGCTPDGYLDKIQRITIKKIERLFLEYQEDTPEKRYCTRDNLIKEMAIDNNTPPLYFEHFYSLKEWSENKLNCRFNRDYDIERRFETWIENQGCYADRKTEEYKHWLTLDNLKRFVRENPNVIIPLDFDELNADKGNTDKHQQYILDTTKITEVYNFCVDTDVIDGSIISNVGFINAVNDANFKTIYAHAEQQKTKSKCKYIIYVLSKFVNNDKWYLNTAHSIDTEPNKCSGITVPADWKEQANSIK
jgi:hypothetical protein